MAREKPPQPPDELDDPAFRTQKLPGIESEGERVLSGKSNPPPTQRGTADHRLKSMEEAVRKAKTKQTPSGASTRDAYSADEIPEVLGGSKQFDEQKATSTLKIKRVSNSGEDDSEPQANTTLKIKRGADTNDDDEPLEPAESLLRWYHWVLLLMSFMVTGAVAFLILNQ